MSMVRPASGPPKSGSRQPPRPRTGCSRHGAASIDRPSSRGSGERRQRARMAYGEFVLLHGGGAIARRLLTGRDGPVSLDGFRVGDHSHSRNAIPPRLLQKLSTCCCHLTDSFEAEDLLLSFSFPQRSCLLACGSDSELLFRPCLSQFRRCPLLIRPCQSLFWQIAGDSI